MATGVEGAGQPDHDVVIIGGGHNGLVAAAYLARAGLDVTVLEAQSRFGGAVASAQLFDGVAIKLSRFSYLVSLLPRQIIDDLGLELELRSRRVASYTPTEDGGLLVERRHGEATRASFAAGPGMASYEAFTTLEDDLHRFATVVAPTLTEPLPWAGELRAGVGDELWDALVERPIGELIEERIADDTVRGIVLTDALIGTFASAHSPPCNRIAASSITWSATAPASGRCRSVAWGRWLLRWRRPLARLGRRCGPTRRSSAWPPATRGLRFGSPTARC